MLVEVMGCLSNPSKGLQTVLESAELTGSASPSTQGKTEQRKWRRPRRLSPAEVSALAARYRAGANVRELADEFGVHKHTVSAHLAKQAIPTRIGGRVIDEAAALRIIRLYASGQTMDEIAAEIGVAQSTVSRALRRGSGA